jgi:hypothetical protein
LSQARDFAMFGCVCVGRYRHHQLLDAVSAINSRVKALVHISGKKVITIHVRK